MSQAIITTHHANDFPKEKSNNTIDLEQSEGEVINQTERKHEHALEHALTVEGNERFHRLGWKRLTIILIVQSVALGSLSLPSAFATLGMVAGVILCLGLGCIAIYGSYMIGLAKLKYPYVAHYVHFGRLLMGGFGEKIFSVAFVALMILTVGSHCLTGKIAFTTIAGSSACALIFSAISAVILFVFAIPPSFAELSILGFIDFASIIVAIGVSIISTGIQSSSTISNWSAWPKNNLTLSEAFVAISNIAFAYSFAAAQPSFMDEMHNPTDFTKAIGALGVTQMSIYTLTGALIYAFVGQDVESPALLSAGPLIAKIAFGVALPVIFISGSINTTVACRYIHGKVYENSVVRYVNTMKGWITWLSIVALITILAWIITEAIPFFSELLSICGALLVSGFSFYIPPVLWFFLLREGSCFSKRNIRQAICNLIVFLVGICVLGCGLYASITEVIVKFKNGSISRPFSCGVSE
ncbi:hypothetical protein PENANT_c003G04104 [Penicillium antarcticum]|uniref:Amino acid transporter transmembrane domain-containing protein n=1 Tax=Penicillium antarcticum TaxID=416450 RepID=A0A1V6QHR5_9EURO|nr:uncharacterized protein N7508_005959 [Penicillium antarcticum]KAJ5306944.1 hypothetical protein N7508_005959 [Penicillium antarcticum]OQD88771.1 hypothetical protein PENANT_c003G04104 [Penicillium antarcticum]